MSPAFRIAWATALVAPLAGCFDRPSEQYACQTTQDCDDGRTCERNFCVYGAADAADTQDADTVCPTFMARHFDACMIPKPMGDLTIGAGEYTYVTTTGALLDPASAETMPPSAVIDDRRVLSVSSFTLPAGSTLRVAGALPLVIASWDTLVVQGTIDVSSEGMTLGAGAHPTTCTNHRATPGTPGAQGGAGGGGGSMQSAGGTGGVGSQGASNVIGGPGGAALAANVPLLEGGCPGETGGMGGPMLNLLAGAGGPGGGAVQLTARTSITIGATGRVSAGGGGGGTGAVSNVGGGGGGGGSGGMIGLEAPTVTIEAAAILAANGGGGGQGGGQTGGQPGQNAQLGAAPAAGGTGGSGGNGGAGSVSATPGGNGNADGAGGGGGGGGAGYITIKSAAYQPAAGAVISPAATIIP